MQLSLSAMLAPRHTGAAAARVAPPPWRDSAISQLEAIAAAQPRATGSWLHERKTWVTLGISALLLMTIASLSPRAPAEGARRAAATLAHSPAPTPLTASPSAAATEPTIPIATLADAPAGVPPPAYDRERKQRARPGTDAQRRTAPPGPEPVGADVQWRAQPQAEPSQRPAEPDRPREVTPEAAPAQPLAPTARRGVREACAAAGNFFSEQFCQARECRKTEQHADAVCTRLRELEAARQRAGAER